MIRSDVLKTLIPLISEELVVTNIGLPSQEMHLLDDQPTNFYMLGTMGLASSIGLGLAMAQPKKVIAIDGDGSVLMNLGTLPTIANNQVPNFILLIVDNGSYGSTGDQTTYAGMRTSLASSCRSSSRSLSARRNAASFAKSGPTLACSRQCGATNFSARWGSKLC